MLGCGRHGVNIAGELARRGCFVVMCDETEFASIHAKHNLQAALLEHVQNGLMVSEQACSDIMSRVQIAETLDDAIANAAVVFEAVRDEPALKRKLFRKIVRAGCTAPLTTNTITLSLSELNAPFNDGTALSVVGCRFLHPVWFVDDVEVDLPSQRGAGAGALTSTLADLGLVVRPFKGERTRLSNEAVSQFMSAQRAVVRRERTEREEEERARENMGQENPSAAAAEGAARAGGGDADGELEVVCAVCLDRPPGALLKPCGHTTTCMECAAALRPPLCVTCRAPIERIVPWRDL